MKNESKNQKCVARTGDRRKFLKNAAFGIGVVVTRKTLSEAGNSPPSGLEPATNLNPLAGVGERSLVDQVVGPENTPDAGAKVRLGSPREMMLAPEGDERWGFFMFPCLWRLRDGRLVCAVTLGEDEMYSESDYHYLWYISYDNGQHWTHAVVNEAEAELLLRERFTLAGGRQIYYEPKMVSVDAVSAKPFNTQTGVYEGALQGINLLYRLGDLPEAWRTVTMYVREAQESEWRTFPATMDPDILVPVFKETVVDRDPLAQLTHGYIATRLRKMMKYVGEQRLPNPGIMKHNGAEWATTKDLENPVPKNVVMRMQIPTPPGVRLHNQTLEPLLELNAKTLLVSTKKGRLRLARPRGGEDTGKYPNIFQSTDGGRSWSYYSSIPFGNFLSDPKDPHANKGSYSIGRAHITVNMPKGNWMAVLRTSGKWTANSLLLLTRSYDQGRIWTPPVAIRPSSTNPVGGLLANGVAYRLYGRPGQFITFCADGEGKLWGNDVTLVPAREDPKSQTGIRENTCANSSVLNLGPDRFLVAYTDYDYQGAGRKARKAVLVREIVAEPSRQV